MRFFDLALCASFCLSSGFRHSRQNPSFLKDNVTSTDIGELLSTSSLQTDPKGSEEMIFDYQMCSQWLLITIIDDERTWKLIREVPLRLWQIRMRIRI